ncbi:Signal recognition particle subunit SRP68 [Gracilariopsis chorda]|uniref:Signal recognition particle subunit SRP68 n=1 Tax=Gracilariopsis chorda TaxID=448386 RepID=A0A2V3IID9_9FLOR|nr:Signal recognition particle subunit SRP68 [Gracilariopsis chorda]|eukprot:PXF40910.1 Signal recognition particle subunit SRP68 [Gracilariopsis chorda]
MVAVAAPEAPSLNGGALKISLAVLSDITAAQSSHGLKHADHLRYRRYCTRRLSRLRSATNTSNKHPGHHHRYHACPITVEKILSNERSLQIPLVLAEREWAFAMDVKREQAAGPSRTRRTILAKLSRAVHHAEHFAALCRQVADDSTVLEAEAYAKTMIAALALEREQWATALHAYESATKIYTGMAGMRAGTAAASLFEKRLEDVAQGIRFCKYNLARSSGQTDETLLQGLREDASASQDLLSDKIETALSEARKRAALSFGDVTWCGVTIPLRAERVREAVLMASEESKLFSQKSAGVDAYDKLFLKYNDAVKVVSDELAQFRSSSAAADDRIEELEHLIAYLTFSRLQHTISRNLLLVQSYKSKRSSKPEDFVRLFDNLIANMNDVLALKGVENDAQVAGDSESRRKLFRAHRCYHLAQCYQAAHMQKEAAALYDRVAVHAKALSGKYGEEAQAVVNESKGLKCRAVAEAYIRETELANRVKDMSISEKGAYVSTKRMIDHLDACESFAPSADSNRVICDMPPALEAIPCKPVLFDLAIDGIRFPGDVPRPEQADTQADKVVSDSSQGGLSSFSAMTSTRLGRWWSGKG